ncbi:DUF4221 family protein [Membranicola marinus]|uniref:DUF4221 family protein n=1 Tax=Membranihabitans marinus TaxID=1227546 RepID=A0A953LD48_9BACT|nr:DUF4221 family protein [Membranihabitans marinus]MBY5960191.1 DUF4221 family protein [Membranihabitans marinus]
MSINLMKPLFYLFPSILILLACTNPPDNEVRTVMPEETDEISITIDTIRVNTPGTTREFPYYFPSLDFSGNTFAGLDERTGKINVFKLPELELIDTIQLYQEGPNTIQKNMVGAIYYHNQDSIFILQHIPKRLLLIDHDAVIQWQVDVTEAFKRDSLPDGLMPVGWFDRIGTYYENDKLYFAIRQEQAEQDFLTPMIGYYDFRSDHIKTLDIHYPAFYTKNENVGTYGFPGIQFYENNFLITYPYSTETFVYDQNINLLKTIQSPSRFEVGKAAEPAQGRRAHAMSNPYYYNVQPLKNGSYYVQLGREPLPEDPKSEIFNFTIIYNHDFTKYHVIDKNEAPISFGGEYFYYPIPQEETEYQSMERYKVEME